MLVRRLGLEAIRVDKRFLKVLLRKSVTQPITPEALEEWEKQGSKTAKHLRRHRVESSKRSLSRVFRLIKRRIGTESALDLLSRTEGRVSSMKPFLPINFSIKKILPLPPANMIANHFYAIPKDRDGTFLAVEPDGSSKNLELPFPLSGDDRVYRFNRATIFAGSSLFESGGKLWWDSVKFAENSDGLYPRDRLMVAHDSEEAIVRGRGFGKKTRHFKRALSLLDSASSHFGHFALGTLPKLRILQQATRAGQLTLIVDKSMPPKFLEFISDLNLGVDVAFLGSGERATVDELMVPETLKYFPDVIPKGADTFPYSRLLKYPEFAFLFEKAPENPKGHRLVSLLRSGTGENRWRRNSNDSELRSVLNSMGFSDLSPLISDFPRLRNELSAADVIVTVNGSITHNLILAGVRGKIIVILFHPGYGSHREGGVPGYLALMGNHVVTVRANSSDASDVNSDWWLDPGIFRGLLSKVL
jgi:hypothetical protein